MLRTYEGNLVKGRFYPRGKAANIPDDCRVIVTLLDDTLHDDGETNIPVIIENETSQVNEGIASADNRAMRKSWLEKLNAAILLALDEELPEMQRSQAMREPISLAD